MLCLKANAFAEEPWPDYVTIKSIVLLCKEYKLEPQKITLHCEHKEEGREAPLF